MLGGSSFDRLLEHSVRRVTSFGKDIDLLSAIGAKEYCSHHFSADAQRVVEAAVLALPESVPSATLPQ